MDLKTTRASKRITQMRLWKKTGIAQSKISSFEHGYIRPTEKEKEKIAKALGLTIDQIDWDRP